MARARRNVTTRNAYRNIERLADEKARTVAEKIVDRIAVTAPYDEDAIKPEHLHLRNSYYVTQDPETGDALIRCRRRYWAYVEYGTRRHNFEDAQPHVSTAIDFVRAQET